MSGHNKWSKIKHKKGATDAARSRIFSKHSMLIAMESRVANGNVDSPKLAAAIAHAKKDSMPKDNIERAVAKGAGTDGATIEEVMYEGYGPGGVALLIQAVTDNNNRTTPEIRYIFTKAGLELGAPGSAAWAFEKTDDGYKPTTPVELDDETGEKLAEFIEKLEENDDITNVYTTADSENE